MQVLDVTRWRWNLVGVLGCAAQIAMLVASAHHAGALDGRMRATLLIAALAVAATGATCLAVHRRGRRFPTLVWPFFGCATLAAAAVVDSAATAPVPGMLTVCFAFIGLTQRPYVSLALVPFALPALGLALALDGPELAARGLLTAVMWLIVAEVPASLLARLRDQGDELRRLASTDRLTGLLNRHALDEALVRTTRRDAPSSCSTSTASRPTTTATATSRAMCC